MLAYASLDIFTVYAQLYDTIGEFNVDKNSHTIVQTIQSLKD